PKGLKGYGLSLPTVFVFERFVKNAHLETEFSCTSESEKDE
ncbi:MAG: hypothetical protein ACI9UJ_000332, partial [bacterium]